MPESEQDTESGGTSRRRFLGGSMAAAVGLGIAGAGSGVGIDEVMASAEGTGVDEPLGWTPVNPDKVRKLARQNYYAGMHCAEGVAHTLIQTQRENGNPRWKEVPSIAVWWGAAGGGGNGALCGTVTGASTVTALAFGRSGKTMKVVDAIHQRYQQTPFPQYEPPEDTEDGMTLDLPANRSKSPLCHVSVTKWCKTSGYAWGSKERAERCSRVAADMAGIAAELLNAEVNGNFEKVADEIPEPDTVDAEKGCVSCHSPEEEFSQGGFVRTRMECTQCHSAAPHMPDFLQKK